jgi:TolB-like protein/DNA-binding winged helix-turn-helix (wHTH) protein/Flp pilus assembly protein TadD
MEGDFRVQDWVVSPKLNSLSRNGKVVRLEPKVMQVLVCLAESGGVVSKEKLMNTVWADTFVTDDVLTRSISELRKVFEEDRKNPRFIQTISKGGYRLVAAVADLETPQEEQAKAQPTTATEPASVGPAKARRKFWVASALAATALLAVAYVIGRHTGRAPNAASRPLLAVLPFHNLNNDPQQDYFADGLTAEMISQVGRLPSDRLGVIAWNTMVRYKDTHEDQNHVLRHLGADYLLEGTVRRSGNEVRVTAELLREGKTDHIWSNSYTGTLDDVLAIQNRIAREIASEILVQLSPQEDARFTAKTPVTGAGYDAYLKARVNSEAITGKRAQDKIENLKQAIRLSPAYAPPYVSMASQYRSEASLGLSDPKASYEAARTLIAKALEIDPNSSGAYRELAWIEWRYEWNFSAADRDFRHALELNPNEAVTHDMYELYLRSMGRNDEALTHSVRARELNPMEFFNRTNAGSLLGLMKRFDEAHEQFRKALENDPEQPYVYERLGPVYLLEGKNDEAIKTLEKARDLSGGQQDKLGWLGYAYGVSGRKADAFKVLDQFKALSAEGHYVSPLHVALVYSGMRDRDNTLSWLERAYEKHDEYLVYLNVYPEFQWLQSDPHFQEILKKVGLRA